MLVSGRQLSSLCLFRSPVWCRKHCQDERAFRLSSVSLPPPLLLLLLNSQPVCLSPSLSIILAPRIPVSVKQQRYVLNTCDI